MTDDQIAALVAKTAEETAKRVVAQTFLSLGIDANSPLYEVHTGKDMSSVNFSFIAKGQAY